MWYSKLMVSCACLLLLHLEMGAARATVSGPSESLYATARDLGLDAAGLEEIWRTGLPLVIRNERGPNDVTTVTYTLRPDRRTITKTMETKYHSSFSFRENWDQADPEFFLSPFLNPFGSGFTQDFFENWARSFSNQFLPCCQGFNGHYNPNNPSPPPSNRIPNDRNPSARPPSERPRTTPNIDESNSNDSQWVPVPEDTTRTPFVPLPTLAPSNNERGDSVIDDFLAKVDVTTADIKEEDGEYVRTIIDQNGRILKAKFELVETRSQDGQRSSK